MRQLSIDDEEDINYADIFRCQECHKLIETKPIEDDSGYKYCDEKCRADAQALAEDLEDLEQ